MRVLAKLKPGDGLLTRGSSPHVMWLAEQLNHVCWLPPAPARART
jgi:hypothetical protein